jgi:hypothetical protein
LGFLDRLKKEKDAISFLRHFNDPYKMNQYKQVQEDVLEAILLRMKEKDLSVAQRKRYLDYFENLANINSLNFAYKGQLETEYKVMLLKGLKTGHIELDNDASLIILNLLEDESPIIVSEVVDKLIYWLKKVRSYNNCANCPKKCIVAPERPGWPKANHFKDVPPPYYASCLAFNEPVKQHKTIYKKIRVLTNKYMAEGWTEDAIFLHLLRAARAFGVTELLPRLQKLEVMDKKIRSQMKKTIQTLEGIKDA